MISSEIFQQLVQRTNDLIVVTLASPIDPPGPIVSYVNPAFCTLTGYGPDEIIGQSTRMLYGLAKDGQATRRFGLLNARGVPTQGVFFTTAFLFAALPVLALGDNVMAAFTVVTSVSSLTLFIYYRAKHLVRADFVLAA